MKKIKQILAILGVILLLGLYLSTFFCAISSSPNFMDLFLASLIATIIIPVLLWAFLHLSKVFHPKDDDDTKKEN